VHKDSYFPRVTHGEPVRPRALLNLTDTTSPGSGDRRASESYLGRGLGILSRKPIREVSSARRNRRIGVVGLRPAPYEYGYTPEVTFIWLHALHVGSGYIWLHARFQRVSLFAAIHSGMTDAFRHDSAPCRAHIFT
jgi:hypothetical protein